MNVTRLPQAGVIHVGVAVVFYCVDGEGHVLLHRRSDACRDERGHWDFGGGQIEFGEEVDGALRRELREEYGCAGTILTRLPTHALLRIEGSVPTHWIAIPYVVQIRRDDARLNEPVKMDTIGWFSFDAVPAPLHTGAALTLAEHGHSVASYAARPAGRGCPDTAVTIGAWT